MLTCAHHARHMAWLAAHGPRQFPMRQWRWVFFTDESRFTLFRLDGQCRGERFADACVLERDRFGGGSVMVWGGISHGLKSPLIVITGNLTGVRFRDEILRPVAVPFVQQHHLIFQQDNARPHAARVCQDFLANHNINPLDWPLYSPDLSPMPPPPLTLDQLRAALLEEWDNIPMRINALVDSMHRRIRAVTDARGGAYVILSS